VRGRLLRLMLVATLAGAGFAVHSASVAFADDHDPVGYTFGVAVSGAGLGGLRCNFYKIDLKTGAATQVNAVNASLDCADGLTFDEDGTLYAYRNGGGAFLVTVDKHTGAETVVGQLPPVLVGGGGMTFDADGHLWLYAFSSDPACAGSQSCLYEVNKKTASARFVGTASVGVFGLAGDCEDVLGITLSGLPNGASTAGSAPVSSLQEVNTHNGALHKIADTPGIVFPTGLDFDSEGDLWALASNQLSGPGPRTEVVRIDPNNGNTGSTDVTVNGVPFARTMTGLAVSPIGDCDPETTTTTTTPAAPVVAAAPTFTG
jgi:hypothetical protein